ncbi:hypothetical protein [Streptomyces sp. NBC_00847]|uniref:hypothetical protein n=1 Tax=Streptomyces sp. NBC_00847 TaxID=2975850 RepID=UPI0022522FE2|nr:hypothetical protein [Streptomyces sp. NBC_00847]MCX4881135.1 hypothetical protein [Streptomyces sp. NBC_00847]
MKKWREDAQPEWPEAASEAQALPIAGEARRNGITQSFPDTARTGVPRGGFADIDATDVLSGGSGRHPEQGRAVGLRDPWEASGESAQSHDPHEVTVQLDAVGMQQDRRLRNAEGETGGGSDGCDAPVFVDESGRRSRRFRRLGIAVGTACAVYAVVIVVTLLSGSSDAPWLPVPGQKDDKPAGQVEPTSRPADSARPAGTGTGIGIVVPGSTPTASDGTTPSPGASGTAHGKSAAPAGPGASADPGPTPSKSATKPGPGVVDPVPSASVNPPTSSSPTPSPSASSVAPSQSPGGTGGTGTGSGSGPVADGPSSPSPVTEEPGTPVASSAPSPEPTL